MAEQKVSKPLVGISACLVGETVRYDAGHKRQSTLISLLAPHTELSPFCPEVAAGLGVPRPPVQLIETSAKRVRALGVERAELDVTQALSATAAEFRRRQLDALSGFIFKGRSPSCGLGSTPLSSEKGELLGYRDGLFAAQIREAAPWLPCVEEDWLQNPENCFRFLGACCLVAYYRHGNPRFADLATMLESELTAGGKDLGSSMDSVVDYLLSPDEECPNAKAALGRRLSRYFTGTNGHAGV